MNTRVKFYTDEYIPIILHHTSKHVTLMFNIVNTFNCNPLHKKRLLKLLTYINILVIIEISAFSL